VEHKEVSNEEAAVDKIGALCDDLRGMLKGNEKAHP
jgi:hypothetical protein